MTSSSVSKKRLEAAIRAVTLNVPPIPKAGAPKRRDAFVRVRVTAEEKRELDDRAKLLGMTTSEYVRQLIQLPVEYVGSIADLEAKANGNPAAHCVLIFSTQTYNSLKRILLSLHRMVDEARLDLASARNSMSREEADELLRRAYGGFASIKSYDRSIREHLATLTGEDRTTWLVPGQL